MNYQDLHQIEGLQFIPVNAKKIPTAKAWQTSDAKHDLSNSYGVGLVCGKLSGGVEVIDVDEKYDITGNLFERFKKLVHSVDDKLLSKLVVQKTKSGGHHLIYRCSIVAGNMKLANRHTTEEEKNQTYKETYQSELAKSCSDEDAKKRAQKSRESDKVRVLFETRGEGGYVMCYPSPSYEITYGDFYSITEITPDERETLLNIARQFNEVFEEYSYKQTPKNKIKGSSSFDDYNERGDVVALLESHGWRIVNNKGAKTVFLRPGQTTSTSSGNYDHDKKWFSVFTTSTEFEPQRAYMPYAVFAILECNKDFSEASRKLYDMGFGEKEEPKKQEYQSTRKIQSRVDAMDNDFSFLANNSDYDSYLQSVRDGTLQMGLTTGFPTLDKNFMWKEGNLVMTNGIDNTGKSVVSWYLTMVCAMIHGWEWLIFSSENTLGNFMRKCIQFYWGKQLGKGNYQMNQREFDIAKKFVEEKFKLIKAQEELFNYKDIINMVRKARIKHPKLKGCIIDPYNSLKTDLSGFSKLSTHEYHYEALSELKAYGQQTNFGWIINNHAVTSALRMRDADRKYPIAPRKEDTEGGGKFANKADDFLTIHRVTQHPTDWMVTEIHVRKIKDTETGGLPTPIDSPIKLEMYRGGTAFKERDEAFGSCIDPIEEWHRKRNDVMQSEIKPIKENIPNTWLPYAQDKDDEVNF